MRFSWPTGAAAILVASQILSSPLAHAAFPDVPSDHLYRGAIDRLVELQVVKGNPDGKFYPSRAVNRAEMLTMLYRALGKTPASVSAKCFADVQSGSWYESIVCDAAANHYVEGYGDSMFKPEKEVNRVEALKMVLNLFEMPVSNLTDENRSLVKFVDVSLSAWYTKFMIAAYVHGVLPIPGQSSSRFYPDAPLLRGEAAAYISNALDYHVQREAVELRASSSSSADAAAAEGDAASTTRRSSAAKTSSRPDTVKNVDFPFSDEGSLTGSSVSYRFTLKQSTFVDVETNGGNGHATTCRLFKLADEGFSSEYYIGTRQGDGCRLRVMLGAGSYQLDVGGTDSGKFSVFTKGGTSSGNDGFIEAKVLLKNSARSSIMEVDDYVDCYKFTVSEEAALTIELSTSDQGVRTLIYPMSDVDLYGFSGPVVNASYLYPKGTYYACVMRGDQLFGKQTYSIKLR